MLMKSALDRSITLFSSGWPKKGTKSIDLNLNSIILLQQKSLVCDFSLLFWVINRPCTNVFIQKHVYQDFWCSGVSLLSSTFCIPNCILLWNTKHTFHFLPHTDHIPDVPMNIFVFLRFIVILSKDIGHVNGHLW